MRCSMRKNSARYITFEDIFEMRYFSSYIIRKTMCMTASSTLMLPVSTSCWNLIIIKNEIFNLNTSSGSSDEALLMKKGR